MNSAVFPISYAPQVQVRLRGFVKRKRRVAPLIAGVMVFAALIAQLSLRISILQTSYTIEGLRQENLTQDRMMRDLKLRYESFLNPNQMRERAMRELGMSNIKPQQVRYLPLSATGTGDALR